MVSFQFCCFAPIPEGLMRWFHVLDSRHDGGKIYTHNMISLGFYFASAAETSPGDGCRTELSWKAMGDVHESHDGGIGYPCSNDG